METAEVLVEWSKINAYTNKTRRFVWEQKEIADQERKAFVNCKRSDEYEKTKVPEMKWMQKMRQKLNIGKHSYRTENMTSMKYTNTK